MAQQEGFNDIAACFRKVAEAEVHHEERFLALQKNIQEGHVFKRTEEMEWICINCGYVHKGKTAPMVCPTCLYPQSNFEIRTIEETITEQEEIERPLNESKENPQNSGSFFDKIIKKPR